jgi:Leucine-rich repeat (LRR) protein
MKAIIIFVLIVFLNCFSLKSQISSSFAEAGTFNNLQEAYRNPGEVYVLQLSHRHFNPDTLDLSAFVNLEKLILAYDGLFSLPKGLPKLNKLNVLDISANNFTLLPEELALIPNLEELYLNNDIHLNFDQSFTVINKITHLKRLHLDSIPNFSLPKNMMPNSSIEYLSMRFDGLDHIPAQLRKFEHLKTLDIEGNAIGSIRRNFLKNKEIESLSFSASPQFNFKKSFFVLSKETSLQSLTISNSNLSHLPDNISLLHITWLSLHNNHLTVLPQGIFKIKDLRTLDLSDNDFTSFSMDFLKLKKLETLNLTNDNFLDFNQAADVIKNMPSLHLLQVNDYNFTFDTENYWRFKQNTGYLELFPANTQNKKVHLFQNYRPDNLLLRTPLYNFNAEGFGVRLGW